MALALAKAGADVCVNYRTSGPADADVAGAIRALGRRAILAQADVSERAAVERMVAQCTAELGPVDILVANAVTSVRQNLLATREDDLRRAIDVGIVGTFHVLQVVARQMVERETKGSIIYISSPHARLPFKGAIDYNTAKAGGHMLALSAANELMWHGIRVNLVEPGWTDTPGERTCIQTRRCIARARSCRWAGWGARSTSGTRRSFWPRMRRPTWREPCSPWTAAPSSRAPPGAVARATATEA